MAYPSDLVRTKDWGNEILTDADLEGQLDLIINWVMAALNATTGHKHDGTQNEGPQILINNLDIASAAQGDTIYRNATIWTRLPKGTLMQNYRMNVGATAPEWGSDLVLQEMAAPATAADEMRIYTKDTDGQPEAFAREESSGDEIQITKKGQVNGAYKSRVFATIDGAQQIGAVLAKVDLDAEDIDGDAEFTGATMTIKEAGVYVIAGQISFSGGAMGAGDGMVGVVKAGAGPSQVLYGGAIGPKSVHIGGIFTLAVNDTVELWASNDSGGNTNVVVSGTQEGATYLSVHRIV